MAFCNCFLHKLKGLKANCLTSLDGDASWNQLTTRSGNGVWCVSDAIGCRLYLCGRSQPHHLNELIGEEGQVLCGMRYIFVE